MSETQTIGIRFGAMSDPLREQLKNYKVPAKAIAMWQRKADAITLLAVNELLSPAESDRARKRLFGEIRKGVADVR